MKGDDASLWLSSFEIRRMLCVRRCWIVDGAMIGRVVWWQPWVMRRFYVYFGADQARLLMRLRSLCLLGFK